jgi:hypothetical protein
VNGFIMPANGDLRSTRMRGSATSSVALNLSPEPVTTWNVLSAKSRIRASNGALPAPPSFSQSSGTSASKTSRSRT